MQSEVRVARPGLRVTVVVGACLTVIVIALSLLYRTEFSIILFSLAGTFVAYGVVRVIAAVYILSSRRELARIEIEERRARLRIVQLEADHKALEAVVLAIPASQRIITLPDSPIRLIEAFPGQYKVLADQSQAAPVDLLAALDNIQRCLIVGASDSGKTTLLQHLVARRLNTSKVICIDPHGWPGKWPAGAVVVGTGRAYSDIDRALTGLVQLMSKRYTDIGRGEVVEMGHDKITILIDEWRAITGNVTGAGDAIKALLTESRKAAFSVFVASHSDRAKPLGLAGEYDLRDGFCIVRLALVGGQRQATIDSGNGEQPAALPGAFVAGASPADVGWPVDLSPADLAEPQPTPSEAAILRMHSDGATVSDIAAAVFGNKGGNQNGRVRSILSKYGFDV